MTQTHMTHMNAPNTWIMTIAVMAILAMMAMTPTTAAAGIDVTDQGQAIYTQNTVVPVSLDIDTANKAACGDNKGSTLAGSIGPGPSPTSGLITSAINTGIVHPNIQIE